MGVLRTTTGSDMIVLCTDFGLCGPFLGQVQAVLIREAPGVPVINLFADLPAFNARAAAYLLAAYAQEFVAGTVFLCVVDPGVGSSRRALTVRADNRWFVGPDNGLLSIVARHAHQAQSWVITYAPARLSASFHGRDLFAPVAARLAMELPVQQAQLPVNDMFGQSWPNDLYEIVYIDHYGNLMTGVRACTLNRDVQLAAKGRVVPFSRTFSEALAGEPFWYENANGLVEIALREAHAAQALSLKIGDEITLA